MKNGFTLIELIFTIVILAITTMAIPRMVAQTAELNVFAIKQELVMNAKTVMTQIAKVQWDSAWKLGDGACGNNDTTADADRRANAATCIEPSRIHIVPGGDRFINARAGIVRIPGIETGRGMVTNLRGANLGAVSFGAGAFNDLDDYNGFNSAMVPIRDAAGANTTGDFLLTTDIAATVTFVADPTLGAGENYGTSRVLNATFNQANAGAPTNTKMLSIGASDRADPGRNVVLATYSFNIGSSNIVHTTR